MKISRTTTFDSGVEDVFAVISSPDYQQAKVAAQVEDSSATVTELPRGLLAVHTERTLSTQGMPASVASLVGDRLTVTEQQTWQPARPDGARAADLEITVKGVPLNLRGTITLAPAGAGSVLVVDADLTCSLPFVGKKIEAAARPVIEESFDLEVEQLSQRLS